MFTLNAVHHCKNSIMVETHSLVSYLDSQKQRSFHFNPEVLSCGCQSESFVSGKEGNKKKTKKLIPAFHLHFRTIEFEFVDDGAQAPVFLKISPPLDPIVQANRTTASSLCALV